MITTRIGLHAFALLPHDRQRSTPVWSSLAWSLGRPCLHLPDPSRLPAATTDPPLHQPSLWDPA